MSRRRKRRYEEPDPLLRPKFVELEIDMRRLRDNYNINRIYLVKVRELIILCMGMVGVGYETDCQDPGLRTQRERSTVDIALWWWNKRAEPLGISIDDNEKQSNVALAKRHMPIITESDRKFLRSLRIKWD